MNEYTITEISPGMEETFDCVITSNMVDAFCDLTGDINPLHKSEEFAKSKGFNGRVSYGMLTAALISKLAGCLLPGKNCLIQGLDLKFVKPVYIGDELHVSGKVSKVDKDLKYLEIKVVIRNQK